jgi:hypothetical protein
MEVTEADINECANVLRIMYEIVEEVGHDFFYTRVVNKEGEAVCRYIHNGCPSCFIGKVLEKLGWTIEEIMTIENVRPIGFGDKFSRLTKKIMCIAQLEQDRGRTWYACSRLAHQRFISETLDKQT